MSDRQLARWRLASQRLVGPHAGSSAEVVTGLLAVQAENPGQAAWAVASRTARPDAAELATLLDEGRVIRTHVLRPTWHFVAAEDIGWLLELTAPRVRPVVFRQFASDTFEKTAEVILAALAAQPDQDRDMLAGHLRRYGLEPDGFSLMLLLAVLELDRLVCSGRPVDGRHTYALFSERVPDSRRLDRDEALAELAVRYFGGHGPATERDLAYWATLPLRDVRRGIGLAEDRLASFDHDGRTFWHAPQAEPPGGSGEPSGRLLQILDEIYRGYQDTRMVIDSRRLVPPGREPAVGMALVDAQMVAWMKRTVGSRVTFDIRPLTGSLLPSEQAAIEQAAARYDAFLGLDHAIRVS